MKKYITSLIVFAAASAPVFAEDAPVAPAQPQTTATAPTQTNQPAKAAEADPLDQMICKDLGPPTGTRLGSRKTCMTRRQWEQSENDTRRVMDDRHMRGDVFSGNGK